MTGRRFLAIMAAMTAARLFAYDIQLEPDAAKRRTVAILRSQGPETAMLYLYAPAPWVIAGSAITAQDDTLWSGFNTTPNNPTHIYRMLNAHSSQQYVIIFGFLTQPGSGYGRNPWFQATVPAVDIDWEKHAGTDHEDDENTWTGLCPVTTNQSERTKVIVRKLKDDRYLVTPSMTLECWPTAAVRFLKEDGATALWSGVTLGDNETPLTLYVDPKYPGSFQVTLSGPMDDEFKRPTDYLTGMAVLLDLDVDANHDGAIGEADDPLEEDPGGILATGTVKQVNLKLEPAGLTGELRLSAESGGSRIRLWREEAGGRTEVTLPAVWDLAGGYTFPAALSVEGLDASAAERDVHLRLRYTAADGQYIDDNIRLTVVKIVTKTVAEQPPDQTRKIIGVGEEMELRLLPATLLASLWTITDGDGELSYHSGNITTYTAPDIIQTDETLVTITAIVSGTEIPVHFKVISPSGVLMKNDTVQYASSGTNWVAIKYWTKIYLQPDTVNFGKASLYEGGSLVYSNGYFTLYDPKMKPHEPNGPHLMTETVVEGKGTLCWDKDEITGVADIINSTISGNLYWDLWWSYTVGLSAEQPTEELRQNCHMDFPNATPTLTVTKDQSGYHVTFGTNELIPVNPE